VSKITTDENEIKMQAVTCAKRRILHKEDGMSLEPDEPKGVTALPVKSTLSI
jgi:hypothetical protein